MSDKIKHWVGVDLDGTLAFYDGWKGPGHIGDPIPKMQRLVLDMIEEGTIIKIFTARATIHEQVQPIHDWLAKHGFPPLEVTNVKDFGMVKLFDDRCVQVRPNTGDLVDDGALAVLAPFAAWSKHQVERVIHAGKALASILTAAR